MPSPPVLAVLALALASGTQAQLPTLAASDFSSGTSLDPFYECTFRRPSYAQVVDGELETFFDEADYDGTRVDRGIEICADIASVTRELWHGFSMRLAPDYPVNKQSIVAQNFCLGGCSSWCATLDVVGTSLQVDHRSDCSTTGVTTETIVDEVGRGEWHDVVINARFSNSGDGHYTVWWDGDVVYDVQNVNLGFDSEWDSEGRMTTGVGFKNGQYNANTDLYDGGTRTIYFDNVSWYNVDDGQTDGYEVVAP
ncbi:hypothetical protein CC79DRAFT_1361352 [Sarocladium strictum]